MISLNKPKIYQNQLNQKIDSIDFFLNNIFGDKNIEIVFSARQGLDLIYHEIYKKKGVCRVAVSPLTCFDALFPIINNKHIIVFVDVNPETFNMDESLIPKGIDIIQPIHFGGNPQNMNIIIQKANINSALIVEDCAQAFGSSFNNIAMGNFGDYSSFSFVKNLHSLGGGFIVSKGEFKSPIFKEPGLKLIYYRMLKRYLENKNSYNSFLNEKFLLFLLKLKPLDTSFIFSGNRIDKIIYRSIEIQLDNYKTLIESRKKVAIEIRSKISNDNLVEQQIIENGESVYTRLLYKLREGNSVELINRLRKQKIWANHLSQNTLSNYQESVYENKRLKKFLNPNLKQYKKLHDKIISIPVSPALSEKEIDYIAFHVNKL